MSDILTKQQRDEAIGMAVERVVMGSDFAGWARIGLAAIAVAREIDICETCEHSGGCAIEQGVIDAKKRGWYSDWNFGCNRHEPKEA